MARVRPLVFALIAVFCLTLGATPASAARKATAAAGTTPAFPKYSKAFQLRYHVSPKSDPDNDGLNSYNEFLAGTNPKRDDSDKDGRGDGEEDRDKDGLTNAIEQAVHSSPARRDTNRNRRADGSEDRDHDGLSNLAEQRTGNDPLDTDSDDDGRIDGDESVGRVVRFDRDTGTVRLWLASERRVVTATLGEDANVVCPALPAEEEPPVVDEETDEEIVDESAEEDGPFIADETPSVDEEFDYYDPSEDIEFGEDEIADDGSMCIDSVKRGVWFSNAEFYEDESTGDLIVDLLELAYT